MRLSLTGAAALALQPLLAAAEGRSDPLAQNAWALEQSSNFHAVYDDAVARDAFYPFLRNVFHLFPAHSLHRLITSATVAGASDQAIYTDVQNRLSSVSPFMAGLRYALPALWRQKHAMRDEALQLLRPLRKINGYLEIGTTGRYLSALQADLDISGDRVLLHTQRPGYGLDDIAERSQLGQAGRFVDLRDYAPLEPADVADASLDLVTNFIGFHHAPADSLDGFVRSLHRVLRPGGRLLLRDHAVDSAPMNRRVALAHDVFNMGLHADWASNQRELRHFTSLAQLTGYLEARGFRRQPGELYQFGDPTHNALMLFLRL